MVSYQRMNIPRPILAVAVGLLGGCAAGTASPGGTMSPGASASLQDPSTQSPAAGLHEVAVKSLEVGEAPFDLADIVTITAGEISGGQHVWVLETVDIDGEAWHLVASDRQMGEFDLPFGWIPAVAGGSPTVSATDVTCPPPPLPVESLVGLGSYGGLACYGNANVELLGYTPLGCGAGGSSRSGSPEWLNGTWTGVGIGNREPAPPDFEVEHAFHARAAPGATVPAGCGAPGWYRFTGHFDDPAAPTCRTQLAEIPPVVLDVRLSVLLCRTEFVITEAVALPAAP